MEMTGDTPRKSIQHSFRRLTSMLRDDDIRIDIGRCTGVTFLRVVHLPTGVSRTQAPLDGEASSAARARLLAEVERELAARGLWHYIVPAPRARPARQDA
jgi:hypothetical protein